MTAAPRLSLGHQTLANAMAVVCIQVIWDDRCDRMLQAMAEALDGLQPNPALPIADQLEAAARALVQAAPKRTTAAGADPWARADLQAKAALAGFFQWRAVQAWDALRAATAELNNARS